jgi:hypothetical protein
MSTTSVPPKTPAQKGPVKPKSPAAPSHSLDESVTDAQKLYDAFGRGAFTKVEYASTLKISSNSGPTTRRLFAVREYGLVEGGNDSYKISEDFIALKGQSVGSAEFQKDAYNAILKCTLFKELIEGFNSKLPAEGILVTRLEQQKKFNLERAKELAKTLISSLRYAQVVDGSGNIVVSRSGQGPNPLQKPSSDFGTNNDTQNGGSNSGNDEPIKHEMLRVEVTLKERGKVVVLYPPDLTADEAQKVGNVLVAIVS